MSSSIQDEFKVFKDELRKLNIEVQKVVKVGTAVWISTKFSTNHRGMMR
jgi:hypothetical protein